MNIETLKKEVRKLIHSGDLSEFARGVRAALGVIHQSKPKPVDKYPDQRDRDYK